MQKVNGVLKVDHIWKYPIGKKFVTFGKQFTITSQKCCKTTNEYIYIATSQDSNVVWRGTEPELEKLDKNWIMTV